MPVSRLCDNCGDVKRCRMYSYTNEELKRRIQEETTILAARPYLCGRCARELGWTMTNTSTEQAPEA